MFALLLVSLPLIAGPDAPVTVGWWPLPPGWWLLGLTLFLGLLWLAYLFLRRFIRPARAGAERTLPIRARALAALDELEQRRGLNAREAAYRLNEILRAALPTEKKMAPFDQEEWQHFWQEMEMRYQPDMTTGRADVERWLSLARGWIEQLPLSDVSDTKKGIHRRLRQ